MAIPQQIERILPKCFSVPERELCISGEPLSKIIAKVAHHPFYVYAKEAMLQQIELLKSHLPAAIELHYAIKANPMPEVIQFLADQVNGFDVASAEELKRALAANIPASEISFAGPGKSVAELELAVESGVLINCESTTELERIEEIAVKGHKSARVALRVNPDFNLKTSGMKMGGGPQPFGIDAEVIPEILSNWPQHGVSFEGFHIFSGSQNLNPDAIIDCQNQTLKLAHHLSQFAPSEVKVINMGGGFGIPYFPKEKPLTLDSIGENLHDKLSQYQKLMPETKFIIELGRYIVGPAGVYISQIIDIKISRGQKYYIVNGGLNHHLAASGNFGQIIRKNYPVAVINKLTSEHMSKASVVGPLCTPLDLLSDRELLADAEIGDYIGIFQSGAYGLSASPQGFLSHPPASEILI